jgi:3-phenylpropionate/cinnamic acid dioxygenase small subunit
MTPEDRVAITDLISMHGHLTDSGQLDRMTELFTDDVVYDLTDYGQEPLVGRESLRQAALALGDRNPVGHHVTNIVLTELPDEVRALSKGLGVMADGTCGSATYEDVVVRTSEGWRISRRRIVAHRAPLGKPIRNREAQVTAPPLP